MNPLVFDVELSRRGHFSRSYNLANDGQSVIETQYSLERLFDAAPCCVKLVVAEIDFATFGPLGVPQSYRSRSFFTAVNAIRYLRYYNNASFQPGPEYSTAEYVRRILTGTALHYTNAGIFKFWIKNLRSDVPELASLPNPLLRGLKTQLKH